MFYIFQSTCPARGTTIIFGKRRDISQFQSTCPARGTTGTAYPVLWTGSMNFNPRAPRGARRLVSPPPISTLGFQSTCPARGTTGCAAEWVCRSSYFNPRAPRGARPCDDGSGIQSDNFNPRAPRGARLAADSIKKTPRNFNPRAPRGARLVYHDRHRGGDRFQSTCPARGTTACHNVVFCRTLISIHVPREGHDLTLQKF